MKSVVAEPNSNGAKRIGLSSEPEMEWAHSAAPKRQVQFHDAADINAAAKPKAPRAIKAHKT